MVSRDTGKTNMQEMALDLLTEIRDRLGAIEQEQAGLREIVDKLAQDLNTIHKFQQSFSERLGLVESFCVDQPLQTTPIPRPQATSGNHG